MNINERNTLFRNALATYRKGDTRAAAKVFRQLIEDGSNDPQHLSYHGLSVAFTEGKLEEGTRLCARALHIAPYDAEMYLNLARVHFRARQRVLAIEVLRKGLRIDEDNRALQRELQRINPRSTPALDFLSRSHPVNRYIGLTRTRLHRLFGREKVSYLMC
ncbi:MAG TPA: tetratricopeptide repeat protein [Vicinamibacteria bacterium]|jgi:predicted Zn-dependent protease